MWSPLFVGERAKPYTAAIDNVLADLERDESASLAWSKGLLYAYAALARGDHKIEAAQAKLIDQVLQRVESGAGHPGLFDGGVSGALWLAIHTDGVLRRPSQFVFDDADDWLIRWCQRCPTPCNFDLTRGLVGIGVYFLERFPEGRAEEALSLIVDVLQREALSLGDRVTWHTPATLLSERLRHRAPDGCFNLGVAHGVPGVIGFLGQMRRIGLRTQAVDHLLRCGSNWVLSQRLANNRFPAWVIAGVEPVPSRIAWCYGELGLATVLLLGAQSLSEVTLTEEAIEIASGAAQRRDGTGAIDCGLCHGYAGNGHLFNRLFQATGEMAFRDAAEFWFGRALDSRQVGDGFGGFLSWRGKWNTDGTFLTGAAGVALALIGATTSIEPHWDRLLLSNIRPSSSHQQRVP